ncbi:nucleotidyltransferase domain-containing protein [uncultured Parabacteroides sp.]|uniref:nucleotidyltransferase domain-containing protein n=1 Tax=uncultured Parabacteroides sp. TaxID=512312 RepID=UPI00261B5719|nr:nucleotidyltransferase domain-containing protein [uncultured Parabacteroides sp.]
MKYGLSDTEWNRLETVFNRYPNIERAILYGSRAKGNYKPFSDVDITLVGERLTRSELNRIVLDIDDLLLPYQFDVSIFHRLTNPDLIDHIERKGIILYQRNT